MWDIGRYSLSLTTAALRFALGLLLLFWRAAVKTWQVVYLTTGDRQPTGRHLFDQLCANKRIEYRLIQPRHPPTNGIVERLNGRIAEILGAERLSPPLICKRRSQATFGRTITEFPNALGTT